MITIINNNVPIKKENFAITEIEGTLYLSIYLMDQEFQLQIDNTFGHHLSKLKNCAITDSNTICDYCIECANGKCESEKVCACDADGFRGSNIVTRNK